MLSQHEIQKNRRSLRTHDRGHAAAFKSLGEINRFRIFKILAVAPMISVSAVANILGISVPLTSQHVKSLEAAQLLTKVRSGKVVYLRLNHGNPFVEEVVRSMRRGLKPKAPKKAGA